MQVKNIALSIVICSTRPINTSALLLSIAHQLKKQDQLILIFDILIEPRIRNIFSSFLKKIPIEIYYNSQNEGLSYCRNFGMEHAKNPYLIFFDDDVLLPPKTLHLYRHLFAKGFSAIGGPLKLPPFYADIPRWLPRGLSSLLGIHTYQKRVWGANFGFKLQLALKNQIFFKKSLGRKKGTLQSGDETDFLHRYSVFAGDPRFIENLFVYHCIDVQRFKISYLLKRSFWQGKSEYRKLSVVQGLKKEWMRSTTISDKQLLMRGTQFMVGILLFFTFCSGIFVEYIFGKNPAEN